MTKKIGLIIGNEHTFPQAFIDEVNRRAANGEADVQAEFVVIGGTEMDEPNPYAVIIDRISHEVPYYRAYLKNAVLQGTHVINNPFWWYADDKFIESSIATKIGVAHPKTVVLPNKAYVPGIVEASLRNLEYPINWDRIINYIGFPAFLKPAVGGGWKNVYKVHNKEELFRAYDETGELMMILQENIDFEQYVRCFCLGRDNIMPVQYDPRERRYVINHAYLTPELGKRIVDDCIKLNNALGYDMNTVEFAVRDGIPYAIDFLNPAPDFDLWRITDHYFDWVVKNMATLAIDYATGKRQLQAAMGAGNIWQSLMMGQTPQLNNNTATIETPAAPVAEVPSDDEAADAPKKAKRKKATEVVADMIDAVTHVVNTDAPTSAEAKADKTKQKKTVSAVPTSGPEANTSTTNVSE